MPRISKDAATISLEWQPPVNTPVATYVLPDRGIRPFLRPLRWPRMHAQINLTPHQKCLIKLPDPDSRRQRGGDRPFSL